MPVNAATLNFRQFFVLAPEVVLSVWGLIVLAADLGPLRTLAPAKRKRIVGIVALAGALITLGVTLLPLLVRNDPAGAQAVWNFTGIDYTAEPDPVIFFGSIAADLLTEYFNVLLAALLILVVWMSPALSFTEDWGEYYALVLWSTVGMMLLTASDELLTLFLTLETMTICLYLLTAFEKGKRRSAEGGLKYFVYGSVSSALFLFGLSLIYGLTGTTQFYAIRMALTPFRGTTTGLEGNIAGMTAVMLVLVGFGFKVAAVPFHQWAPDAYEGAPAPVTAWVATGSKVASMIAMMKVLLYGLAPWSSSYQEASTPGWLGVVAVLAGASMTYGNFAALAQTNFKRMLAYSSIAHAGYMLVGVAAAGVSPYHNDGTGGVLFYLVIYAFGNIGAFALAVWLARDKGSDEIADLNGLAHKFPLLAVCILLLMLSLIGMPPLGGFFGKLYMFMEALDETKRGPDDAHLTMIWLVGLGLLNSVVSAFYYVRVLKAMFLRPASGTPLSEPPSSVVMTIVLATVVSLGFGLYPEPLIEAMKSAGSSMVSSSGYLAPDRLQIQKASETVVHPSQGPVTPQPPAVVGTPPAAPSAAPETPKAKAQP